MQTTREGATSLPRPLGLFALGLFLLSLVCAGVELVCKRLLHLDVDPYNYPLLRDHYPDFLFFIPRFHYFHSLEFFTYPSTIIFMYPAPVAVFYKLFYLAPHPLAFFLCFILTSLGVACFLFGQKLKRRGIASYQAFSFPFLLLVCSYPVWFEYKQANMEIVLWVLVTSGLAFFLSNRGYSAAACFGLAASMKIYPFVYLGLLLMRRQCRQIAFGLGIAAVATIVSLWLVYPSIYISWHEINKGVETFRYEYMLHRRVELGFDHSLLSPLKLPFRKFPTPERFAPILTTYLVTVATGGLALFVFRIRQLPVINQILCLTLACVCFPPVSFEYTLMHLLFPLALLVLLSIDLTRKKRTIPGLNLCLGCFFLLLGTLPELIARQHRVGGQFKAVVLAVLFFLALRYPMILPDDGDAMLRRNDADGRRQTI